MAAMWDTFLEVFRVGLFWLTQFYGGHLAAAIISFSMLARLALLPLTVRLTLRTRAQSRKLKAIQPELVRVRERWKDDSDRLMKGTLAVYQRHGVSPLDTRVLKGSLVQTPVFIGLFHAVRAALSSRAGEQAFFWVSNLARPDVGVAILAFILVGLGSLSGASESQPGWTLYIPAASAAVMAMTLSAGFGLYLAATGAVSTLQGLIVRRIEGEAGSRTI